MKFTRDMNYKDKWHFANEDRSILIEPIDRGDGFMTLVIVFTNPYTMAMSIKRDNYIKAFFDIGIIKKFDEMNASGFHLISLDKTKASNVFYKTIEAIENIEGKDSCIEIRKLFDEILPKYQPQSLLSQSLFKVQKEIDSGNKSIKDNIKHLPQDLKDKLNLKHDKPIEGKKDIPPNKGSPPSNCNMM